MYNKKYTWGHLLGVYLAAVFRSLGITIYRRFPGQLINIAPYRKSKAPIGRELHHLYR